MRRKKKIAIVGAGNAGCVTALHYFFHGKDSFDKIEIYYDSNVPIEKVGQGTALDVTRLLAFSLGVDWYNNFIKATPKIGVLYDGWGKKENKFLNGFPFNSISCHYVPNLLSQSVLNSGYFKVFEKDIQNSEEEIDADYVFDCRGKLKNKPEDYDELINPLNSVILSKKEGRDYELNYTKCVATPDGWTFVIPNIDSVSYGYLYNNTVTTKQKASKNFQDLFDVVPNENLSFSNYIAKNAFVGERTILNGNRLSFLEPLEATSTEFYLKVAKYAWDHIVDGVSKEVCNQNIRNEMNKIETFILWHYQNGSKYDTDFWRYAKSLPFKTNDTFDYFLENSKLSKIDLIKGGKVYSQWHSIAFKIWNENVCQ